MKTFIKNYQKKPVEERANQASSHPKVSACVQTYQHAAYIAQCIESLLMQKTDFDIEILIGEDDSSDGTREICEQYADSWPEKIRLFLHSRENNISLNGHPSGRFNFVYNLAQARGEYIAFCEGDDYWTDKHKLQKQVDAFEADKELGIVYTGFIQLHQKSGKLETMDFQQSMGERCRGRIFPDLLKGNWLGTATVMVKKKDLQHFVDYNEFTRKNFPMADYPTWLELAYSKKVAYLNDKTAVHRILENSASQSVEASKRAEFIEAQYRIKKHFIKKYKRGDVIEAAIDEGVYRKRIQYAFFTNDQGRSEKAKTALEKQGNKLSLKEQLYYRLLKTGFLASFLRRILISFGVKV